MGVGGGERGVPAERRPQDAAPVPRAERAALRGHHAAAGGVGLPEGAVRGLPAGHGPHPPAAGRAAGHQSCVRGQGKAGAQAEQAAVRRRRREDGGGGGYDHIRRWRRKRGVDAIRSHKPTESVGKIA